MIEISKIFNNKIDFCWLKHHAQKPNSSVNMYKSKIAISKHKYSKKLNLIIR